ncbi:MAG TPA: hypothetical protein VK796_12375 [Cytophaga sp.]|jgi:hypothetical protein|nr:hypothetical protein [Cytophaga sp.]
MKQTLARTIQIVVLALLAVIALSIIAVSLKAPLVVGIVILIILGTWLLVWSSHNANWS